MVNLKSLALAVTALFSYIAEAAPTGPELGVRDTTVVKDGYIVTLKSDDRSRDLESHISWVNGVHKRNVAKRGLTNHTHNGIERKFSGKHNFNGYSGEFDELTIEEIRNSDDVDFVEEDKIWTVEPIRSGGSASSKRGLTTEQDAPWGLGAISHRKPGSTSYIYNDVAGKDAYAYVIDTGIMASHSEFQGRAEAAWSDWKDDNKDTDGHGTHVAGTLAGKTYGVAKKAKVLGVKVFQGGSGKISVIIDGLNWAVNDIHEKGRIGKSVINMSLAGCQSKAMNQVINKASGQGIVTVAAAGNNGEDASNSSPASAKSAVVVGAVDSDWEFWESSNWGKALDILAPGVDITSAGTSSDSSTAVYSGTSQACPHVAGLVLSAMTADGVTGTKAIKKHLVKNATPGAVRGQLHGSVNTLANNGNSQQ